jgi:acetyl-CoA synthetase (ADP-forming)
LTKGSELKWFFSPESIAVIGASRKPGKIGHEILRNIKLSGFAGKVFPINPDARYILDYKCYRSVSEIDDKVDLAVIVVPALSTESAMIECGKKNVHAAIIISSGFGEIGNRELETKIIEIARKYHTRVIGPNTFGIFHAKSKMNATFGPRYVLGGKTAFITQSGALGLALMSWTTEEKYGVSSIVSIGNKADVDDADLLDYFAYDESVKSILIYMEGLKDGRKFFESAMKAVLKKPIVVIKAGSSRKGAQAASSHTGSIAGQDIVFSAAFKQAGVMRAESMTQAFDWIQAINENPIPKGENIVVVTNGGGIGVLATDECEKLGLRLMEMPSDLKKEIKKLLPSFGSLGNPIDLTANANDEVYHNVVRILLSHQDVHGVLALFCETANNDPLLVGEAIISCVSEIGRSKAITAAMVGGHLSQVAYSRMLEKRFAAYPTAERAVDGMYALMARRREMIAREGS